MSSQKWNHYELFIVELSIFLGWLFKLNNEQQINIIEKRLPDRTREAIRSKLARLEGRKK